MWNVKSGSIIRAVVRLGTPRALSRVVAQQSSEVIRLETIRCRRTELYKYSTVQYITVQYIAVQYSTLQYYIGVE